MYISVSAAAEKFNISKRRVQLLCEQGRIKGADRISGVWLIPDNVQKPTDARRKSKTPKNPFGFDDFYKPEEDKLSIEQVCERLSVSRATVKNWVRLGKLTINPDNKTFDKKYIDALISGIKSGEDTRLKSRRNKKSVNGKTLYKDYISSSCNCKIIENILNSCEQVTDDELRMIIANFAIQLYQYSGGTIKSKDAIFQGGTDIADNIVFNDLITDLLANVNISKVNLENIRTALNSEIQSAPSEDVLGFVYISLRNLSQRKQTGAYYTPQKTVNKLIKDLKNCTDIKCGTFCDPCCGTGNFLMGLIKNGAKIENIYGQDIDEISIFITRINMFLLDNSISKKQLYSHFVCGDTLSDTFAHKFSAVLGNPPWGYNFSREEAAYLTSNYITAKSKGTESYDLFIEKGLSMLKKDGYLAYVLPESILSVNSHKKARELIAKRTAFRFVNYLGNAFSGVQCPAVILGIQNGYSGETKGCKVEFDNERFVINEDREIDAASFSFNMSDEEYSILCAIDSAPNPKYLANNAKFALGIVTGNNKGYITNQKKDGAEVILKGSDILRYAIKETDNYICFAPDKFQQVAPLEIYRAKEKLLYRFIAEVPVFTYDNHQTLSLNSCNILIPQIDGMNIKYVMAVLNSRAAAYYLYKKYNSVKLLKSHIESLPIPMVGAEKQNDIIKKVDRIMNSTKDIGVLYEDLDSDIMELYGLNAKQSNIIRTSLKGKSLFLKDC